MKFKYMMMLILVSILLSACAGEEKNREGAGSVSDGESAGENNALEHGVTDQAKSEVGFEMTGDDIEEAQNVPKAEKKAILETFETYMTAFNEENLEKYMSVIATEPEGFDYEEEKVVVQDTFAKYDVHRTAEDVTVIKYNKNQAQVFASLSISLEQKTTGAKLDRTGRQVTVFAREDGNWRVTSVYFIGDAAE
jgi:ketosteroid isomerase-like protein